MTGFWILLWVSKMELFAKTVDSIPPLTIFAKSSILDVWMSSEYASDLGALILSCYVLKTGSKTPKNFLLVSSVSDFFQISLFNHIEIVFVEYKVFYLIILNTHFVTSVRIRSFSSPYFPAFRLNTDQKNTEYGHFSCRDRWWYYFDK